MIRPSVIACCLIAATALVAGAESGWRFDERWHLPVGFGGALSVSFRSPGDGPVLVTAGTSHWLVDPAAGQTTPLPAAASAVFAGWTDRGLLFVAPGEEGPVVLLRDLVGSPDGVQWLSVAEVGERHLVVRVPAGLALAAGPEAEPAGQEKGQSLSLAWGTVVAEPVCRIAEDGRGLLARDGRVLFRSDHLIRDVAPSPDGMKALLDLGDDAFALVSLFRGGGARIECLETTSWSWCPDSATLLGVSATSSDGHVVDSTKLWLLAGGWEEPERVYLPAPLEQESFHLVGIATDLTIALLCEREGGNLIVIGRPVRGQAEREEPAAVGELPALMVTAPGTGED